MGLGRIPSEYTNNANESANVRIKAKVDYKKSELNVFCIQMKELVDSQTQDIEKTFCFGYCTEKILKSGLKS